MKNTAYLFTDEPQSAPGNSKAGNHRREFSFSGAVNRILNDVDADRFPIKRRKRDCERVALPVSIINRLQQTGETEKLQVYIAQLFKGAVFDEDLE